MKTIPWTLEISAVNVQHQTTIYKSYLLQFSALWNPNIQEFSSFLATQHLSDQPKMRRLVLKLRTEGLRTRRKQ
eukprot:snap_masked-scaffold_1-processed-gene-10.22-mRNA-1 protein AED:1.00 eAED:1.00 QI:0/-1/0/0/-1/1/1/0/73